MYRTHTCGELRIEDADQTVTLSGWVQRVRDKGGMIWIDLRDKYGVTQLMFEEGTTSAELIKSARTLGREFVIRTNGKVIERVSKNLQIPTGEIEIKVEKLDILNPSKVPPFIIEDKTDGGEELRMKYRYLDLRRSPIRQGLELRHELMRATREYLDGQGFTEIETPVLIKSTPEGARDFVVPSRMNPGEFYALPQSPQTFKQLLMVAGFDRYFQIVKCFRDEDLRADRQPEFTQIDCEMSFVDREDVLHTFQDLITNLFKRVKNYDLGELPRYKYDEVIRLYGTDKPDTRFEMTFVELNSLVKGNGFNVFDQAEIIIGINCPGYSNYSRKQLDELTDFVRKPQIGAKGLVYVKYNSDGSLKSSVDKFYSPVDLTSWFEASQGVPGDLLLILAGEKDTTRNAMSELRLEMGQRLGFRDKDKYSALWVTDFPLMEWDEQEKRFQAMHHPFTSPLAEDMELLESEPGQVRANAYDMVINGVEAGGGSIRIHDREFQEKVFQKLGFSSEEASKQFGFLMDAFQYGAPPHGGIAFGFDRLCALLGGSDTIRDYIAFPKNNSGRDVMIDTPSEISQRQLDELSIGIKESIQK